MIETLLQDRVVLITGANHGIGAATAKAFAAQSAAVAIHFLKAPSAGGRDGNRTILHAVMGEPAADEVVRSIREQGGRGIAVEGDLADPATIPALFDRVEAVFGPVEVVVNNAAHCEAPDTIFSVSASSLERYFAVNTRATVLMIAEFVRRYRQRGAMWGRIINLSTDAAQAFPGQILYGASKAAIEAFTRSIAIEVGPLGITINTVAPGPVQTEIKWITPEMEAQLLPVIPLRRVGQPEDIADVIVFLASDQARWLTGQVIKVSGGHEV
ncbi:MAG: SDR family NAD(P)-dependent oxidoreductase [Anaerolineales bacterium]